MSFEFDNQYKDYIAKLGFRLCGIFYNFVKFYGGGFYIDYYTDMNTTLNQDKDPQKEFFMHYMEKKIL